MGFLKIERETRFTDATAPLRDSVHPLKRSILFFVYWNGKQSS